MTGRPSIKIPWIRTPTPDYPLTPFLLGVTVFSIAFLMATIFWSALSSIGFSHSKTVEESLVIAMIGFVIPILCTYSIVKSLRFSRWIAAVQIVTPPLLVYYLIDHHLVEWVISPHAWVAVSLLVLAALVALFFSPTQRKYYAWVRGDEGDHRWVSPRWARLTNWVARKDAAIYVFFEVIFLLFAVFVLLLPWIVF